MLQLIELITINITNIMHKDHINPSDNFGLNVASKF